MTHNLLLQFPLLLNLRLLLELLLLLEPFLKLLHLWRVCWHIIQFPPVACVGLASQCHINKRRRASNPNRRLLAILVETNLTRASVFSPHIFAVMPRHAAIHLAHLLRMRTAIIELARHKPQVALVIVRLVVVNVVALEMLPSFNWMKRGADCAMNRNAHPLLANVVPDATSHVASLVVLELGYFFTLEVNVPRVADLKFNALVGNLPVFFFHLFVPCCLFGQTCFANHSVRSHHIFPFHI